MEKPAVARRIVRCIRTGPPAGRFLKKADDGHWYDVGDRQAAEKTSQGLRERSNAEKRQRLALREALKIRKQDLMEDIEIETPQKRPRLGHSSISDLGTVNVPTLNYIGTNLPVPLSLNMKDPGSAKMTPIKKKSPPSKDAKMSSAEISTAGLPPNAVDADGNVIVTDYDILCGRGGLVSSLPLDCLSPVCLSQPLLLSCCKLLRTSEIDEPPQGKQTLSRHRCPAPP